MKRIAWLWILAHPLFLAAYALLSPQSSIFRSCKLMTNEKQLTFGLPPKDLDNNVNFSPDGNWLVFDCREEETGIPRNRRLGRVQVSTGKVELFYEQMPPLQGVGAASFLNNREVLAMHALTTGLPYDFTARGGRIIPIDGKPARWLDSRDVVPPFTPGALRGGTHNHEPDATGEWVGFTYNDHIMKFERGSDLRNVGVSRRGIAVNVEPDGQGRNFRGESFSVLLTACVDNPMPGSDEYRRAEGDCWVGREGYLTASGKRQRARAFRGQVAVEEGGQTAFYSEVFIVDVPEDLTVPGPLGRLEGTATDYPKPPKGAVTRRLTRTTAVPDRELRGVTGHLRASGDGGWIAFVGKIHRARKIEAQVFVVSPTTGEIRQLSDLEGGVAGDPRFSPNSRYVVAASTDGRVVQFSAERETWGRATSLTAPNANLPRNLVISPDSRIIAYNRAIEGVLQVFRVDAAR